MPIKLTPEDDLRFWLSRIIDDLDPNDFSSSELVAEFGAATGSMGESTDDYNGEKYIRNRLARLVAKGFVAKIAKGRYQVTDSGTKFRNENELQEIDDEE
jgi:hypothetical protein